MSGFTEKTIKAICRNKIDDLCKYIAKDDEDLAKEFKKHCFISGGAITSLLQGEQPNDFDIYIDNIDTLYKICEFYTNQWNNNHKTKREFNIIKHIEEDEHKHVEIQVKSSGIVKDSDVEDQDEIPLPAKELVDDIDNIEEVHSKKYTIKCITSNALSLSDDIQIICRFCGTPNEIFKNYDFIHTMQAYYRFTDDLILNTKSLTSIMAKRLEYNGSLFPICSLFRLRKFLQRGWTISSMEILKIAYQISKLDLDDVNILKEQLCGCDFAYMMAFCNALHNWREENPDIEFNSVYMFELIEKVFDKDYSLGGEDGE